MRRQILDMVSKTVGELSKEDSCQNHRKKCFHAFRHTWVGALRRADVPEEIRKRLGGWKIHGAEGSYGPEHLPRLLKYLRKINYPGLDLSSLYP